MVKFTYYSTKACYMYPKCFFLKLLENQITANFIYLTSPNFVTISHISYWDQVNSWKNLWKFWNGLLCRNKSGPFPLLNVAVCWQSSDTEACAKKLLRYLQTTLIKGWGRLVSEFMWGIVASFINQLTKTRAIVYS